MYSISFESMYMYVLQRMCVCSYDASIHYRLTTSQEKIASMEKPAIHLKFINTRVACFFDILGKAIHRPYCADEVILTRSDDLVQPTIG